MSAQDLVPTVQAPEKLASRFLSMTFTDQLVAVAFGCITLLIALPMGFLGFVIGAAITTYFMWPLNWGRRYFLWTMKLYDAWTRFIYQDILWENTQALSASEDYRPAAWWRRWLQKLFIRRHPYPLRVDWLEDIGVGIMHNEAEHLDTVAIGSYGSDIPGMSVQEQYARHMQIADVIRRLASYRGIPITIRTDVLRRPYDLFDFDESLDNTHFPDVVVPSALIESELSGLDPETLFKQGKITKDELLFWRLNQLTVVEAREEISNRGSQVTMATFISVRRDPRVVKAARSNKRKPLSEKEAQRLLILRFAREVMEALERASVSEPRLFSREECIGFLEAARSSEPRDSGEITPEPSSGVIPLSLEHPQYGMYVSKDSCVIDSTGHITIRIVGLTREIETNLIPRIFTEASVPWLNLCSISETASGQTEYFGINWLANIMDDFVGALGVSRVGQKTTMRREALETEQRDLANQGHIVYLNSLVTVSHTDPELLEDAAVEVERVIRGIGFTPERVKGRYLVWRATLASLTCATGL